MIKFENTEVMGWEAAIRGMRNPMNSWEKSDSGYKCPYLKPEVGHTPSCCRENMCIGFNDLDLMKRLRNAGTDHRKFMRMITVYVDVTAPLYWWKEFDTYKVGTVANSCSTMHKIADKEFTLEDFSHEHLLRDNPMVVHNNGDFRCINNIQFLMWIVDFLNENRRLYLEIEEELKNDMERSKILELQKKKKQYWWQMIQLLPSSYNQKRTVMTNYEVLANIYKSRKDHKLDEWAEHEPEWEFDAAKPWQFGFCDWIKTLPYSELITGKE